MSLSLGELNVNDSGRIIGLSDTNKAYRHKLLSMGLTRGTEFSITRIAPLGDPIEIKIKDYNLSLRKEEANAVLVEKI